MGPFVVLAVALSLTATALAVVAALHLARRTKRLSDAVHRANRRLAPLLEELQAESAVTAVELEHVERRSAARRSSGTG